MEENPLRKLSNTIDRFCLTHPNWGIPGLMRYIIGANVALYILQMFAGSGTLQFLMLDPSAVLRGEIWRIFTYALFSSTGGIFFLINCMFNYWLGNSLERIWGSTKFTFYYVSGVLLTALATILVYLIDGLPIVIAGATFVNSALFFAYAIYNGDAIINFMMIIPIKMKWLAWVEAGLYVLDVLESLSQGFFGLAMMPIIALLNLFVFFYPQLRRRAEYEASKHRPEAINFRKAVREQQMQRGYNHKCTVCGKTDTEYPNLQFRYCSKCTGYHCYCEEHIFNHTHFTE